MGSQQQKVSFLDMNPQSIEPHIRVCFKNILGHDGLIGWGLSFDIGKTYGNINIVSMFGLFKNSIQVSEKKPSIGTAIIHYEGGFFCLDAIDSGWRAFIHDVNAFVVELNKTFI